MPKFALSLQKMADVLYRYKCMKREYFEELDIHPSQKR
jgi:hypothetical protein